MVQLSLHIICSGPSSPPKMQNGSAKTDRDVTSGTMSTLKRQTRPKTAASRQERGACSSTSSCPVFSANQSDMDEDLPSRCPSSLSSPSVHDSVCLHESNLRHSGSVPSMKYSTSNQPAMTQTSESSTPSRKGFTQNLTCSAPNLAGSASQEDSTTGLKRFATSPGGLQGANQHFRSSDPSLCSSSPSLRSSSSSTRSGSSSEDDSWETNSWSSGATCLLRSSIKQHSEEVFRARAGSGSRLETTSDSETGNQNSDSHPGTVGQTESNLNGQENLARGSRGSSQSLSSSHATSTTTSSPQLEQKLEAKLKFSQFLDEVTNRVLIPGRFQAFGAVQQREPAIMCGEHMNSPSSSRDSRKAILPSSVYQWYLPSCQILNTSEALKKGHKETALIESHRTPYLETDIDNVRREDDLGANTSHETMREHKREIRNLVISSETAHEDFDSKRCQNPVSIWSDNFPRVSYCSTSQSRGPSNKIATDGETHDMSSLHEQKEDLRKRLSYTTQKLELMETEFDSTRQYLETELRRAQEELEKFSDKLHRIQSSYAALQRINQGLEDKINQTTQQHEDERRALSQEIIVLNNLLMEAKNTIEKLRVDNELCRKDCNLATQLLQCGKSHHRHHKLSKLRTDLQERVSSHMEKHRGWGRTAALCNPLYSKPVTTASNAKVLEKPAPASRCQVTQSTSPLAQEPDYLFNSSMGSMEDLNSQIAYKSSDLCSSDTALYCTTDERRQDPWQEHSQLTELHDRDNSLLQTQTSTNSNPDEETFHSGFHHYNLSFHDFPMGSLAASSSNSSLSVASDERGPIPRCTLSSSQHALHLEWQGGDYDSKSMPFYNNDNQGHRFHKSFQHFACSPSSNISPSYKHKVSCYSEPYCHSSPRLSVGSPEVQRASRRGPHLAEDDITGRWKQLSMEDINALSYHVPGPVSPVSLSDRHFAMGPTKVKLGHHYSSLQGDKMFNSLGPDSCFIADTAASPATNSKHRLGNLSKNESMAFQSKEGTKESRSTLLHSAERSKDKENMTGKAMKQYVDPTLESLNLIELEPSDTHYHRNLHRRGQQKRTPTQNKKSGSTGLSRKDSLTKAQLYGTLLN